MRLLKIFVLLLISGTAFGQAGASMLMTSADAPVVDTFLLDSFPSAAAAYSLRLLDYSQRDSSAIRVRRSSDNAEQDIGFTSEGYLDTASMKTFVGANSGYVVTWYDQSGNELDATNATAASQPIIVSSGTVLRQGGLPTIDFVSSDFLLTDDLVTATAQPTTKIAVAKYDGGTITGYITDSRSTRQVVGEGAGGDGKARLFAGTVNDYGAGTLNTNQSLFFALFSGASSQLFIDGTGLGTKSIGTQGYTGLSIGSEDGGDANYIDGNIQEIIVYDSDQSANRTAIENNINDHYQLYWNGATAGLLDTYPSDAAYSLRALSSTYTGPLVKVRRSSDNAELDIYATYEGYLDTASLKTFVGANSAYVVTIYDQSGNEHDLIQSTAGEQFRIVNSGAVERRIGHVACRGTGGQKYTVAFTLGNPVSHFTVGEFIESSDFLIDGYGNNNLNSIFAASSTTVRLYNGSGFTNTFTLNNTYLYSAHSNGASSYLGVNGSYVSGSISTSDMDGVTIGSPGILSSLKLNGYWQESIFYNSDQYSNRTAIDGEINTHYSIY